MNKPPLKIKLITVRDRILDVPRRIRKQYSGQLDRELKGWGSPQKMLDRLARCNLNTITVRHLDEMLGTDGWCKLTCKICGVWDNIDFLQLGDEPDYESNTVFACRPCVKAIFEAAYPPGNR